MAKKRQHKVKGHYRKVKGKRKRVFIKGHMSK